MKAFTRRIIFGSWLTALAAMAYQPLSIYGKAWLAQYLIASAWDKTLADGKPHKPWQWADTWPVAKLVFPLRAESFVVLSGAKGNSLAFGPGHVSESRSFVETGTKIIGGHRDTHFTILQELQVGEEVRVQNGIGQWLSYRIKDTRIADTRYGDWQYDLNAEELHLITCYPFDGINAGGPLRYIIIAEKIEPADLVEKQLAHRADIVEHPNNQDRFAF